jgi:hypothetical protein
MWKQLRTLSSQPAVKLLKTICGDPVQLYAVFLIMTVMYYYQSSMAWLYTILAVGISMVLMRFYDFVNRHRILGPLCYMLFLAGGFLLVGMFTKQGELNYPITFLVWFLTPQSVVSFSVWYTIAIYLLMVGFLTGTVYYFAKVRYRMTMQFLIMLIPLSMYAKEELQMPALLVLLLLSAYFLLMVYCRNLRETPDVRRISGFSGGMSVALYVLAFTILAAVVPKPKIQADREYIENAMSYSSWSDVLMSAISMFTESTDNSVSSSSNTRTLYYADAPETLRLRTQTYTYYLADDSWNVLYDYDYPDDGFSADEPLTYAPADLLQAIIDAAAADESFAESYGLAAFTDTVLPAQEERTLLLIPRISSALLPSPTRTDRLDGNLSGNVQVSGWNTFSLQTGSSTLSMSYYSDTYALYSAVTPILQQLQNATYPALLTDAAFILADSNPEEAVLLQEVLAEQNEAMDYLSECNALDWHSETIDALAEEITEGLTSDFDKAKAIEQYFTREGFVYDMSYQKGSDENAADFLTESRRGVCYEFATAMVLLCRSAGLPTRYVQGYSLSEPYQNRVSGYDVSYLIKVRDAHAFPEVYISGYGWLSFEPTVASDEVLDDTLENHYVMLWGLALLGLALLSGGIWLLLPHLRERRFRRRLLHMTSTDAATAVFFRMRRRMHLTDSVTVREISEKSADFCKNNGTVQEMFTALDILLYSSETESPLLSAQLAAAYIQWYDALKHYEKEQKKQQRAARRKKKRAVQP